MPQLIDETDILKNITSLLANPKDFGLIKKPVFPLVESQLEQLIAYIETNMSTEYFGLELDILILSKSF
ncbi:359_t:CDS:2 [Racocetra persica]|uniref:359_t:CDS:1 n=1 Tax=Racocetra persica TaxID=160502 RepID=A0ACA9KN06_9GLOM|nr:359_t:CDS:2 [Racocetra persica]